MRPRNSKKRMLASVFATAAAAAVIVGISVTPAVAAPAPTTYSAGWVANKGTVKVDTKLTGAIGWLVGPIVNPVLDKLVGPLVSGIANLPSQLLNPLLTAALGSKLEATTPPAASPIVGSPFVLANGSSPTVGAPSSCMSGTCYTSPVLGLADVISSTGEALSPLLDVQAPLIQGITERVGTDASHYDYSAQAQVAGVGLKLLGLDLLDVSAIQSSSRCSALNPSPPASTSSVAALTLLKGLNVGVADGTSAITASVGGTTISSVPVSVTLAGLGAEVWIDGNLLHASVGLSLDSLLSSLGLGALGSLVGDLAGLDVQLLLTVGNGSHTDATNTEAWGLEVGIGLSAAVTVDVLGLVGLDVNVGSSSGADASGNLLDLRLAYTNCSATGGVPTSSDSWILPGLT